jgi:hypothetical protein
MLSIDILPPPRKKLVEVPIRRNSITMRRNVYLFFKLVRSSKSLFCGDCNET